MPEWLLRIALLASLLPLVGILFLLVTKVWPASAGGGRRVLPLLPWFNVSLWFVAILLTTRWHRSGLNDSGELSRVISSDDFSWIKVSCVKDSWLMVFALSLLVALISSMEKTRRTTFSDPSSSRIGGRSDDGTELRWLVIFFVQLCWTWSWLATDWRWSLFSFDVGWLMGLWGLLIERKVARVHPAGLAVAVSRRESKSDLTSTLIWQGVASLCLMLAMLLLSAIFSPLKADLVPVAPPAEYRWSELIHQIALWSQQNEMSSRVWSTTSGMVLFLLGLGIWIRAGLFPMHGWWGSLVTGQSLPLTILLTSGLAMSSLWYVSTVLIPLFASPGQGLPGWWGGVALCGALWMACLAISQSDLRKIVGYTVLAVQQLGMVARCLGVGGDTVGDVAVLLVLGSLLSGAVMLLLLHHLESQYVGRELDAWGGLSRNIPRWSRMLGVAGWLLVGGLPGAIGLGIWRLSGLLMSESPWWVAGVLVSWMILISTLLNLVLKLLWGRERIPALPELEVKGINPGQPQAIRVDRVDDLSLGTFLAMTMVALASVGLIWLIEC